MKGILFYQCVRQLLITFFFFAIFTCSSLEVDVPLSTLGKQHDLKMSTLPKEPSPLIPSSFTYRLTSSRESIIYFFKCYNNSYYTERVLPCFFQHMNDLLAYSSRHKDSYLYIQNIFSLFHERLTACSWINPLAFNCLLDRLDTHLAIFFKLPDQKESINSLCKNSLARLEEIKDKKIITINEKAELLAQDILEFLKKRESINSAQMLVIRFLENCLSKLLWDARDDIDSWKTFKLLGSQIEKLYQKGIIPDQITLNHLLWFLINRFIYWVSDLEGSAISLSCYQEILGDLSKDSISFLRLREQKQAITPKKEKLLKAIETGYAKAYFYHKRGILTDPLPR